MSFCESEIENEGNPNGVSCLTGSISGVQVVRTKESRRRRLDQDRVKGRIERSGIELHVGEVNQPRWLFEEHVTHKLTKKCGYLRIEFIGFNK